MFCRQSKIYIDQKNGDGRQLFAIMFQAGGQATAVAAVIWKSLKWTRSLNTLLDFRPETKYKSTGRRQNIMSKDAGMITKRVPEGTLSVRKPRPIKSHCRYVRARCMNYLKRLVGQSWKYTRFTTSTMQVRSMQPGKYLELWVIWNLRWSQTLEKHAVSRMLVKSTFPFPCN